MKSNTLAVAVVAMATLPFIAESAEASSSSSQTGYVDASALNVRSGSSTNSKILGSLSKGTAVQILGQSGNWHQIQYKNQTAFIHKSYVSVSSSQQAQQAQQYIVNAAALNVRSAPTTNASIVGVLANGQLITVQSIEGNWCKISYNGATAYIHKSFVSPASQPLVKGVSTSSEIEAISPSSYSVTSSGLRLRSGPGTSNRILTVLSNGTAVQVIGQINDWYKVKYGGTEGYVAKAYVKPSEQAQSQVTSAFQYPAAAGYISSKFGMRWGSMHYGIDIAAAGNVQIFAAAAGTVTRSYYSSSYGNVVFITHTINGQLYTTVYAHLKSRSVKEGDKVNQGQAIGYMGNTGHSYGQHLHFELHKGEWNISKTNAIDPLPYIQR